MRSLALLLVAALMAGCAGQSSQGEPELSKGYCNAYGVYRVAGSPGGRGPAMDQDGNIVTCPWALFEIAEPDVRSRRVTVVDANGGHTWSELTVQGCTAPSPSSEIRVGDNLDDCEGWVFVRHVRTGYTIYQENFPLWQD